MYYGLEVGFIIYRPRELLKIADNPKVYISRRSLKHFVERRAEEMRLKYEKQVILSKLVETIESVGQVIQKPDHVIQEDSKISYIKCLKVGSKYSTKVVVEDVHGRVEIKSIHFRTHKKIQPFS